MKILTLRTMLMTLHLTLLLSRYIIPKLQSTSDNFFTCFKDNHMKANPRKYHLLLTFRKHQLIQFLVASLSNPKETLPVVLVDSEFGFDEDISSICTKVGSKLLVRFAYFM